VTGSPGDRGRRLHREVGKGMRELLADGNFGAPATNRSGNGVSHRDAGPGSGARQCVQPVFRATCQTLRAGRSGREPSRWRRSSRSPSASAAELCAVSSRK